MKHHQSILIIFLLFTFSLVQSQITRGVVKYKLYLKPMNIEKLSEKGHSAVNIEEHDKSFRKKFTQELMLKFDKNQALYQLSGEDLRDKTKEVGSDDGMITVETTLRKHSLLSSVYSNIQENIQIEFINDSIGVKRDFTKNSKWIIDTTQTKEILGFKCYKATLSQKAKGIKYSKSFTKNELKLRPIQTGIITAWFVKEIIVPFGPYQFGGLPGLILELSLPTGNLIAEDIVIDPKMDLEIVLPKVDKTISFAEYRTSLAKEVKKKYGIDISKDFEKMIENEN